MKRLLILFCAAALLGGCKSYKEKFQDKSVADIGLFADSTITMLSKLDLSLNREETLFVRRFVDREGKEEVRVEELADDLTLSLENIVRYSIDIVNIAEMDVAETNKVHAYADYMVLFRNDMLRSTEIDAEAFDSTIEEVMVQEEFIEALRKAQPLLNAAVLDAALRVDELIQALEDLALVLDTRIEAEYADIIEYRAVLEREKSDIMTAFKIVYNAYRMKEPKLDALRDSNVIWTPEIIPEGRPTTEELALIGEHLQKRMKALQVIQEAARPNWEDYLSTQRELDTIVDDTIENVQQSRIIMLTWVRAHQKMASGTTDPAKWFDIGEVTKSLIKSAPGAIL